MPTPNEAGRGGITPWWPAGLWLGPLDLGTALCAALGDVTTWTVAGPGGPADDPADDPAHDTAVDRAAVTPHDPADDPAGVAAHGPALDTAPSIVLNALALAEGDDLEERLARLDGLVGGMAAGGRPGRVITIVPGAWSGRRSGPQAGRSAMALARSRHWALQLAPSGTTVNAVSVPAGFPDAPPAVSAPVQVTVGLDDLGHVIRFFAHPDNAYVIGQVVPLCGGDFIWSNHSA
jgi:hypothetical protein